MIELIPAIDIMEGRCVRLSQGRYDRQRVYPGEPLEVARKFESLGVRRLHLVDLDGARAGKVVNLGVLESIAKGTSLRIDFGGGVNSDREIRRVFDAGAEMVTAGSIAVKDPGLVRDWLHIHGGGRLVLGADEKNGYIAIRGWQEQTPLELFDFIASWKGSGIRKVICTSISADGMLGGPNLGLYTELTGSFPELQIIASGGVSGIGDVYDLEKTGVHGVIFGKAFYEGKITEKEISDYLGKN